MARLAGVDLPNEKRVEIGLTAIYGIGRPTALEILKKANVDPGIRVKDLSEAPAPPVGVVHHVEEHARGRIVFKLHFHDIHHAVEPAPAADEIPQFSESNAHRTPSCRKADYVSDISP